MYKDILVDANLLHLQNILFDLENYSFDTDIIRLLNDLKSLVDNKMYHNYTFSNYNVMDKFIIVRYKKNIDNN